LIATDLNEDEKIDIVTANSKSNDISILLNRGNGSFRREIRVKAGENPRSVCASDFNGDGKVDLAVANASSNEVTVHFIFF